MKKRFRLTLMQACAVSFLVHSAIAIPFVAPRFARAPEEPPTLVIDLEGLVSDDQEETKVLEQIKGVVAQQTQQTAPPPPNQPPPLPPEPEPELSKEPPPDAAMAAPPPTEPMPNSSSKPKPSKRAR
jgi:periplasmic protein TonB